MRKKCMHIKSVLIIAILAVCVSGIGYASWNNHLTTDANLATGKMELSFVDWYFIDPVYEEDIIVNIFTDSASISGIMNSDDSSILVKLYVQNTGTLPVRFQDRTIKPGSDPEEVSICCSTSPEAISLPYSLESGSQSWERSLTISCNVEVKIPEPLIEDNTECPSSIENPKSTVETAEDSENLQIGEQESPSLPDTVLPQEEYDITEQEEPFFEHEFQTEEENVYEPRTELSNDFPAELNTFDNLDEAKINSDSLSEYFPDSLDTTEDKD